MNNDSYVVFMAIMLIVMLTAIFCGLIHTTNALRNTREKAVELGHAKWEVVNKSGKTEFTWVTNGIERIKVSTEL